MKFDDDETKRPGHKFAEYEMRGVPVRLAMGMRDLENSTVEVARRDTKTKESVAFEGIESHIVTLLDDIQNNLFQRALDYRAGRTYTVDTWAEFEASINDEENRGFIMAHWDGTPETEDKIKELTKATIRCIPLDAVEEEGKCVLTGNPSKMRVVFARNY